jgi:hypothetical protein
MVDQRLTWGGTTLSRINMVGREYGKWMVIGPAPDKEYFRNGMKTGVEIKWWCLCRGCKRTFQVNGGALRAGKTRSCQECWYADLKYFCDNR